MIAAPIQTAAETSRGISLERLIRVAQALQSERFGLLLEDLVAEISGQMGHRWHKRTIYRDVQLLSLVGLAEYDDGRCSWIGTGGFFEQPATAFSLAYDHEARRKNPQWYRETADCA